jgi:hypothetical protein
MSAPPSARDRRVLFTVAARVERDANGFAAGQRVFARTAHATRANVHRCFLIHIAR